MSTELQAIAHELDRRRQKDARHANRRGKARDPYWYLCRLRQLEEEMAFALIERRPATPIAVEIAAAALRLAALQGLELPTDQLRAETTPEGGSLRAPLRNSWKRARVNLTSALPRH